jgi:hypothetical protein
VVKRDGRQDGQGFLENVKMMDNYADIIIEEIVHECHELYA